MTEEKIEITTEEKIQGYERALKRLKIAQETPEKALKYIVSRKGLGCLIISKLNGSKDVKMVTPDLATRLSKKDARKTAGMLTAKLKTPFRLSTRQSAIESLIYGLEKEINKLEAL